MLKIVLLLCSIVVLCMMMIVCGLVGLMLNCLVSVVLIVFCIVVSWKMLW